jgi:predicted lipoprotein with Yx(FWY)xxD motif
MEEEMRRAYTFGMAAAVALTAAAFGAPAQAEEDYGPLKVVEAGTFGEILADAKGMPVYTFDKDEAGKSNCYNDCATNWPPVMATADDKPVGDLTIIKRDDGSLQWADDGKPLYTFINDKAPGEVTGDGKGGVWHVIKE